MFATKLLIILASLQQICGFYQTRFHNVVKFRQLSMANNADDFAALEKKLSEKKLTTKPAVVVKKTVEVVKQSAPKKETDVIKKIESTRPVISTRETVKPVVTKKVEAAPVKVAPVAIAPKKVAAPAQAVKVIEPVSSSISSSDVFLGVGLGLAPYIILPAILLNAAKGFIKKPKPIPVVEKPTKVQTYNKPLGEGVKEGIAELLSDKKTPELELSRKTVKLSLGGFSIAGVLAAVLFATSGPSEVAKEVPKPVAPAPVVKVAPTPAPAPVVVPPPKVAPVAPVPAPAPVVPKPAPAPVPAPVPVVAPVVPKPVPAPAPAPAPVKVEPVAPKPVPAPVAPKPAPTPVAKPEPVVEEVKIVVPKGMEPEKVDLEALKALRKSRK